MKASQYLWEVWRDEYWGDSWNDRSKLGTIEADYDEIEEYLLDFYIEEVRQEVEISGDDLVVYALLWVEEESDDDGEEIAGTYIGYHAVKI